MALEELTQESAKRYGISARSGVLVAQVEPNSPAAAAGIQRGDIVLEIDQSPVKGIKDFTQRVQAYDKGKTILLLIKRKEATVFVTVKTRG